MNSTSSTSLSIVGLSARLGSHDLQALVNRLYEGISAGENLPNIPASTLIDEALREAGIAPGRDVALILLHQAAESVSWPGPVAAPQETVGQALRLAASLLIEQPLRAVVVAETGIGALVLAADQGQHRVYAQIESVGPNAAAALTAAGCHPRDVGYLDLSRLMPENTAEIAQVMSAYAAPELEFACAVGSTSSDSASGLAALIKTTLCLYHRFIPAFPAWEGPAEPAIWQGGPFYVLPRSKTWFLEEGQSLRRAGVSLPGEHIILAETLDGRLRPNTYLRHVALKLVPVTAHDAEALLDQLYRLDQAVQQAQSLSQVADQWAAAYRENPGVYTVALLGRSLTELAKEIHLAIKHIPQVIAQGGEWSTPLGSYFTANPQGHQGKIAFVYPGAFSSYPRMEQDILFLFPYLHEDLQDSIPHLGQTFGDRWLYARSLEKQTSRHWKQFRGRLENNPIAMMEAGVVASIVFTRILRDFFKVQPDMAMGYSLGESSMLFGLGVWTDGEEEHNRLLASPLYQDRLIGPKQAVRSAWGLPPDAPDDFWSVYFIAAPAAVVQAALQKESRVYLTHINTPNETVIAGDDNACKRVIAALGAEYLRAAFDAVLHCDVIFSEYGHFYHMNDLPVTAQPDTVFYSASEFAPLPLDTGVIAHSLSRTMCKMLDFPRLINRVYDDGARVFIELGPRSTCTRWISETLGSREHLSVAINQLGVDDHTALLRMMTQLVSHGVAIDLSALYTPTVQDYQAVSPSSAIPYAQPNQAHLIFLQKRLEGLTQLAEMLRLQTELYSSQPAAMLTPAAAMLAPASSAPAAVIEAPRPRWNARPALFNEKDLQEFATGSIMACFGPDYAVYADRRAPRIPNGDLLLISRIVEMSAERYKLVPGSCMTSEYDIPMQPWFYRDNAYPTIPYSIYMEMALQLCGFLTAYLGSSLAFPDLDFYFRNLDGRGTLHSDQDLSGRTITNTVHLLSSITLEGIIMQKFSFQLDIEGELIYDGEASFGFFTDRAMQNQTGLDKGKPSLPWYRQQPLALAPVANPRKYYQAPPGKPFYRLAQGQLDLLDTFLMQPDGGQYGQGYIYARKQLDPTDWFFYCHFYQDPVMPGSLGVEAILQAMQAFALEHDLGKAFRSPHFKQAAPHTTTWRYRGQVTRQNTEITLEVHIKRIEQSPDQVMIVGDASLWRADGLRIYEVLDIALSIQESH